MIGNRRISRRELASFELARRRADRAVRQVFREEQLRGATTPVDTHELPADLRLIA